MKSVNIMPKQKSGNPKKTPRKKRTPKDSEQFIGLIPQIILLIQVLNQYADQLPQKFREPARDIIGIFGCSLLGIILVFIIGLFVAVFTGHSDQIFTIFPSYIYGIGVVAAVAIYAMIRKVI